MTLSLLFIHLLKKTWKNGKMKRNIFRKSSLNFIFGQNGSRKTEFARSNSSKLVLPIWNWNFLWLERVIFNNNFAWHFSSCDYLISTMDPGNSQHLKQVLWDKFLVFVVFTIIAKRPFFNVPRFLDPSFNCD